MKKAIYRLTAVRIREEGNVLHVDADGEVTSSGWSEPELRLERPTEDAYVLTFVAKPPDGVSQPVILPISASFERPLTPGLERYVVVRSETNEIRLPLGKQVVYAVTAVRAELLGTQLRVYAKGEAAESGWSEGELIPQQSSDPKLFYFVAKPGGNIPVITPIEAEPVEVLLKPPFPEKVTVHAASNELTVGIDASIAPQPPQRATQPTA